MYGSIFHMRPNPGQEQAVLQLFQEWERDRKPKVKGAMDGYVYKLDNTGELVGVAVFSDKDTYRANAEDPAQGEWFQKLRALLQADPSWEDGEVLIKM